MIAGLKLTRLGVPAPVFGSHSPYAT